jgi:hypothetical protein
MPAASTNGSVALYERVCVAAAAVLFVGLTIWQVKTQRDDWPLSSFEMYSGLQGSVASRTVTVGVSDEGEFNVGRAKLGPFGAARLRHLSDKLERKPKRRARFLSTVQERYEASREADGAPVLQGLRTYTETWKIRAGLAGIDRPERRLNSTTYFPPSSLLAELEAERQGGAPASEARAPGAGDIVVDLAPEQCEPACPAIDDAHAFGGRAVALDEKGAQRISATVTLEAGRWSVFLRMKTQPGAADRVELQLDGKRVGSKKQGLGNYREWLGDGAWVWASAAPGAPALEIDVPAGEHVFTLRARGSVRVDQLWLSRSRRELPVWSAPVKS